MSLVFTKLWQNLAGCWRIRWVRRGTVLGLTLIGLVSGLIEIYNFVSAPSGYDPALTDEIYGGSKQRQEAIRDLRAQEEQARTEQDRKRFAEAREKAEAGDSAEAEAIYRDILFRNRGGNPEAQARAAEAAVNLGALAWSRDLETAAAAYREATLLAPNDTSAWNNWGFLEWRLGNIGTAQQAFDQALQLAKLQDDRYQRMQATGNLGLVHMTRGAFPEAERLFLKALDHAEALQAEQSIGWYAIRLGVIYIRGNLPDLADAPLHEALEIAQRHGNRDLEVTALVNLTSADLDRNRLASAGEWARQALDLAEQLGDQVATAAALSHLGSIHRQRGELAEAEARFQEALSLNQGGIGKSLYASLQNKLGQLYLQAERPDVAERWLQEAVRLRRELGELDGLKASLNDLGLLLSDLKRWDEAKDALAESYQVAQQQGDRWGMAEAAANVARLFELRGDGDRQCLALDDSVRLFAEAGDKARFDKVWAALADFDCPQRANYVQPPLQ